MANKEHLEILKQGVEIWNEWRKQNPKVRPDLSKANLRNKNFQGANFSNVNLRDANLSDAILMNANLRNSILCNAILNRTDLNEANLSHADLRKANLFIAQLDRANFSNANLSDANMMGALLVGTNFNKANLTGCKIYGTAAWNVKLAEAIQKDLIITPIMSSVITVDNLEVAQFIYLLLHNEKIRDVIDTITSKVVLILGRFTRKRKTILNTIRNEVRKYNYSPVLFDFKVPLSRDITETIRILAHMAKFVIVDITDPRSVPQELGATVPHLTSVAFLPILQSTKAEYGMFEHFKKYPWVLPICYYRDIDDLKKIFEKKIIRPAEMKVSELKERLS